MATCRSLGFGLAFVLLSASVLSAAEAYPKRPIRIVVPSAPGSLTDVFVRLIGDQLQAAWGQPVVMEFKAGAGGIVGTEHVANSPPDGYTLLMGNIGPLAFNPALHASLPYDPRKLSAIAVVATFPNVLVVPPSSPFKSVKDLIDAAKRSPGSINYASAGVGQSQHLSGEFFARTTGTQLVHVPYRGTSPALTDLMSGTVQIMFSNVPSTVGLLQSGKLKPLAVTSSKRLALFPDVPTVVEAGVPNFEVISWIALVAPPETPSEIVDQLNQAIVKIINGDAAKQVYQDIGASPTDYAPKDAFGFMEAERGKWGSIVKAANIKAE